MTYNVGITGSRDIDFKDAAVKIGDILKIYHQNFGRELCLIVGGCTGADYLVARLATGMMINVHTVLPSNRKTTHPEWRTWTSTFEEMPKGTSYRARDEQIVRLSKEVIGFPSCEERQQDGSYTRSGTWMTLRIASRYDRETLIIKVNPRIK